MKKESIIRVFYVGPQSSHHPVNRPSHGNPQSHWASQEKESGHYAVHVVLRMKIELVGTWLFQHFGEIVLLCYLYVPPKVELVCLLSLTQCAIHLVRMQLT